MADKNELVRILAEEYGITTMKELDEAIRTMKRIDITLFCGERIGKEDAECPKGTEKFCRHYY